MTPTPKPKLLYSWIGSYNPGQRFHPGQCFQHDIHFLPISGFSHSPDQSSEPKLFAQVHSNHLQSINCFLQCTPTLHRELYDPWFGCVHLQSGCDLPVKTNIGINLTLGKVIRGKGPGISVKTVSQHL